MVDIKVRQQLESQGVAITGDIGGQKKKRYWKPDGEEVYAIPGLRDFIRRNSEGKVIETGTRDANYDKGWLDHPPTEAEIKIHCPHCDRYHDTEQEIKACGLKKNKLNAKYMKIAKKEVKKDNEEFEERLNKLEDGLSEIKEMLVKALGGS